MNNELIERLKVDVENWEFLPAHVVQNMREAITALSAPLPDEVSEMAYNLRADYANEAADLLKRLAWENRNLRADCAAFDALIESRGKRIKELEHELNEARNGTLPIGE